MSLLSDFEKKAEAMAETMFDHATVTASLKKKVEAGEASIADAVKHVESVLADARAGILAEVRAMIADAKTDLLGDFGTVSTDAVARAKDAVAALTAADQGQDEPAPTGDANALKPVADPIPVTTTSPSGATVTVDPAAGTTTHVDPVAQITTTLDHASGTATAVDAMGAPLDPTPAVVAEATAATTAAGVVVADGPEAATRLVI